MLGVGVWKDRLSRSWLKVKTKSEHGEIDFEPRLTIVRDNGWVSLELQLVNDASMTTWVEEARIILTDLDATWQTSIPTGHARHEIRRNVRANETLRLSLARAVYDAAGRPQGAYSCLTYVVVRYRLCDEWFDKELDACRVEMAALTVLGLRRSRWYDKKAKPGDGPASRRP
jgi:hypothetical protein